MNDPRKIIGMIHKGETHLTSLETRQKISLALKGRRIPDEIRKKISLTLKGRKLSEETRKKLVLAQKGKIRPKLTEEHKKHLSLSHKGKRPWMLGKKHNEETKRKISVAKKGEKRPLFTEEHKRKIRENRAKQIFPVRDTTIEVKIQTYLSILKIPFYTHNYIRIPHSFQCDILIPSYNLVIECDGDYWHCFPIGGKFDKIRTQELIEHGFRVLRLWERDIKQLSIQQFRRILKSKVR